MFGLETELTTNIKGFQQHKFKRQKNYVDKQTEKFKDYKDKISTMMSESFATTEVQFGKYLERKADEIISSTKGGFDYKRPQMYPGAGSSHVAQKTGLIDVNGLAKGGRAPVGGAKSL